MSPARRDFSAGLADAISGITKPKPSRCMVSRPTTRFLFERRLRNRIPVRVNRQQLPSGDHLLQAFVQFPALVPVQAQFSDKLLVSSRLPGLALDLFQDGGIGKHR